MGESQERLQPRVKAKLYKHQRDAFLFVCDKYGFISLGDNVFHSPGVALMMEVGCGKTLASIAVVGEMYKRHCIHKLLVVCPLSVMGVWDTDFKKFADFDYSITLLTGSSSKKASILKGLEGDVLAPLICHVIHIHLYRKAELEKNKYRQQLLPNPNIAC